MLIFLIGFMGAGKSTAGKLAAEHLGFSFIDLDAVIELKSGKTIADIFQTEGQEFFRNLETATLHELKDKTNSIVAVGGGCPCVNENMAWMNSNGFTIYIKASHGTLFHRLMPAKKMRPLIAGLTDVQLMEYILNQMPVRDKYYSQAKASVETGAEKPLVLIQSLQEIVSATMKD
jgi:shikimate kinase